MIKIAPSILSADVATLKDQIQIAEAAGADWFHLDVMDGHFVPNITFGPLIVEAVRKMTDKPLDVHLMIERPDNYIKQFAEAGADLISVHVEASTHLDRSLNYIRECGVKSGVAINPASSVDFLPYVLQALDLVLIMSVNPGFGGQSFIPQVLSKIKHTRGLIDSTSLPALLEVDGGVDSRTAAKVVSAGADVLVAGSAIFGTPDIGQALRQLRAAAEKA